jgi:D-cysteine desulfhydrase family pyridoxal phosphate-dependent enzyme
MEKNERAIFPRKIFAHLPTPIEEMPRLSSLLDGPELLIKRDDQTGLALGGNKTRKLEYLLGAAVAEGADVVLTTGAAQSNHCRQTAAAAARCGLKCTLVLVGPEPETASANLFLDQLLGAKIIWTEQASRDQKLKQVFQETSQSGKKPYLIPYGGSNYVGAYAYYQAYAEVFHQTNCDVADWIVLASSSGGTQAGLAIGIGRDPQPRLLGISVDQPAQVLRDQVFSIIQEYQHKTGLETKLSKEDILVNDDYLGDGYGIMNDRDREAVQLFAEHEGILLDPVYTGRAGAGLIDLIRRGFFKKGEKVLFWHTGGIPGLFATQYLPRLI